MADDLALLQQQGIAWLVAKNAGGSATRGKIDAARALGLPVLMVQRPALPLRPRTDSVAAVMHWLRHGALPSAAP
jgi:precorrin-6A/cobalt-precorrin-6A reductase